MQSILNFFMRGRNPTKVSQNRPHIFTDSAPAVIYAIGDVHGCLRQLRQIEAEIVADAQAFDGDKWIVMLGDYVDRGAESADVLDHLIAAPPSGFTRLCLAGNHEVMMQAFLQNPSRSAEWLDFGGAETLISYGMDWHDFSQRQSSASQLRQLVDAYIPETHMAFLQSLPLSCNVDDLVFVHAGIRAGVPMTEQEETDLLWKRYRDNEDGPSDRLLIHGHTPQANPLVLPHRICLDTGVFATGVLTAIRLIAGQQPVYFQTAG